ncbi:hypothetical protein PR202_gb24368 [Eleusine coracana subsp. coracana]|uniref:Uncharacterized protein n=1 Tax=Eleusine coracana subsp. coracana TaxID=191504 RepID=A0AAV5FII9_ELECO|nr:hypothetical protein PR202_gb24368 [Eleusine coracana subsp. coracana]
MEIEIPNSFNKLSSKETGKTESRTSSTPKVIQWSPLKMLPISSLIISKTSLLHS